MNVNLWKQFNFETDKSHKVVKIIYKKTPTIAGV
jgi:hypothetical protein